MVEAMSDQPIAEQGSPAESARTAERPEGLGAWVRESINPLVVNLLVFSLGAVVLWDVYTAFGAGTALGWKHLGAALLPGVLLVYIILKTSGRRALNLGMASLLFTLASAAFGYWLGSFFRPALDSIANVATVAGTLSVLLLLRERVEGELTVDVSYGLVIGLLLHLMLG